MKTKNSIVLALVLTIVSSTAFAQVNVGIRAGLAASTFADKGNLADNNHMTLSVDAGSFLLVPINKSFSLRPEINYLRKGRSEETTALNTALKTDYHIHYLQVPLLLQYRDADSFEQSGSAFYINAGPYAAFALNADTKGASITLPEKNHTDWGASFGIGYQMPVNQQNICFDLRYDMGLSNIANQPDGYHTKALSLTVGLMF